MKKSIFIIMLLGFLFTNNHVNATTQSSDESVSYNVEDFVITFTIDHSTSCNMDGLDGLKGKEASFIIRSKDTFRMFNGCAFVIESTSGERYAAVSWLNKDVELGNVFKLKPKQRSKRK